MDNGALKRNIEQRLLQFEADGAPYISSAAHSFERGEHKYKNKMSSASFKLKDIQGIVFGPSSTRFWLFRKHMITMDIKNFKDPKDVPWYSWECLSLQLKHRDVDIVIRDQENMTKLLKFLIYSMDTIDGEKGSSIPYQTFLVENLKKNKATDTSEEEIEFKVRHQLMKKTALKYSILRIRQKISFMAFMKKMTIQELIL